MKDAADLLRKNTGAAIFTDEPLKRHTSFHIGGPADILAVPSSAEDIACIRDLSAREAIPLTILGNGTNVLVRDKGIRGIVLKLGNALKDSSVDGERLICGSGLSLASVARLAAKNSLTGLEFTFGIPGSLGGAVYMNAGAYGGEMKDVLESVTVMDRDGNIRDIAAKDLDLSYRSSCVKKLGAIVLRAQIKLQKGDRGEIEAKMDDLSRKRSDKQPLEYPSAGSTFKRPAGHFAAALIDEAGLKGLSVGDAQVSTKHAGFVINKGEATAQDVLDLMAEIRRIVLEKSGVELEPEVLILGEE